jgi:recombinational DNA repair protein (RecF pathway)
MHIFTSEGIVINKVKYLESDLIVTILLKDEGKVKAIVKGGANSRKRFPGTFEAGNIGEFGLVEKNTYQLMRLTHSKIDNYWIKLKKDYEKILMLIYFLGLTDSMIPEHQPNLKIFDILLYTLCCLETDCDIKSPESSDQSPSWVTGWMPRPFTKGGVEITPNFLNRIRLFYELHLLKEIGLLHVIGRCESCKVPFSNDGVNLVVKTGRFVCNSCTPAGDEIYRIPLPLLTIIKSTATHDTRLVDFSDIQIPAAIFSFTMRIISSYIDKPLKLWQMINSICK